MDSMFNVKKGTFIKKLFNNELSDAEYLNYKVNEIEKLYKSGKISEQDRKYRIGRIDISHSGKSYTLIILIYWLIIFIRWITCYGDIKAVKDIFKKSALCTESDLDKKYKGGLDKIDYNIRQALIGSKEQNRYKNYREV